MHQFSSQTTRPISLHTKRKRGAKTHLLLPLWHPLAFATTSINLRNQIPTPAPAASTLASPARPARCRAAPAPAPSRLRRPAGPPKACMGGESRARVGSRACSTEPSPWGRVGQRVLPGLHGRQIGAQKTGAGFRTVRGLRPRAQHWRQHLTDGAASRRLHAASPA